MYTALLVEDEELAMKRLQRLLKPFSDQIKVIGTANDGAQAITLIETLKPQVVFLDIQMPEVDGFGVLAKIRHQPRIIFTTAYDQYALKAFENHTLDYLLKPMDSTKLKRAIDKLTASLPQPDLSYHQQLSNLVQQVAPQPLERIQVRVGNRLRFIDAKDICFFQARDKYVAIHTAQEDWLLTDSLNALENRLPASMFVRIHRSALVNWSHIAELQRDEASNWECIIADKHSTRLPVSRKGKTQLGLTNTP